jgi:DNA processing protein
MKNVIKVGDERYPQALKEIDDPPEKLYFKGKWDNTLFENSLTVVGSRRMTSYGRAITNQLVTQIAAAGITIISGFMYGIDAQAHKAATEAGKSTVAVMPCGVEVIHPAHQKALYEQILENNGLIISELEDNHPPALWTYPRRNRIMAGLSRATLVVEATEKSGTLITAGFTKKYKRKLFAVPGPLSASTSQGANKLIKEGAEIVTSARDVVSFYGIKNLKAPESKSYSLKGLSELEVKIMSELKRQSLEIDELCRLLKTPIAQVSQTLSLMEIKGILFKERGKYHANQSTFSS